MPHLPTPILPKQLHCLLARILEEHQGNVMWIVRLLAFIFERGYTAPPTVWLPVKHMQVEFDDPEPANFEGVLPSEYLAWCAWINDAYAYTDGDTLTADNWHEWHPIQRRHQLKCLRKTDPAAARELLARFAPNESAEERLALAWVLSVDLSVTISLCCKVLAKTARKKLKIRLRHIWQGLASMMRGLPRSCLKS